MKVDGQLKNAQLEHVDNSQTAECAGKVAYNTECEQATLDTGDDVVSILDDRVTPVGVVQMWPVDSEPENHFLCNGQAVSRTIYSKLFDVIGTMYGFGDGSTTFNVPDYRGYFLRATDAGRGVYVNAISRDNRGDGSVGDQVGTIQQDEFKAHTHNYNWREVNNRNPDGSGDTGNFYWYGARTDDWKATSSAGNATAGETRPKNININYIIRAK